MNPLEDIGKTLIFIGIILLLLGGGMLLLQKIPFLGRLPGDIYIKKGNFTFYFPLVTCILLSLFLTIILSLFFRR